MTSTAAAKGTAHDVAITTTTTTTDDRIARLEAKVEKLRAHLADAERALAEARKGND